MRIFTKFLFITAVCSLSNCSMEIPAVPTATLTITAFTPAEQTAINDKSTLTANYSWSIPQYSLTNKYVMRILVYDTNTSEPYTAKDFEVITSHGSNSIQYSGAEFYTCIFSCVRKAALPFRVYYTLVESANSSSSSAITLTRSREHQYTEIR